MLTYDRELSDGKYTIKLEPLGLEGRLGNLITVNIQDEKSKKTVTLKQYYTKDDEAAVCLFEGILHDYERYGENRLLAFSAEESIPIDLFKKIRVDKE